MTKFSELKLLPEILSNIQTIGYNEPTPVQAKAIPILLKDHDLLGIAQTGTGKTAAFALPIINKLLTNTSNAQLSPNEVRALIMAPTRELATQIHENIIKYTEGLELSSAVIIGGTRKERQIDEMSCGKDIVVATPGRLMDLMGGGYIKTTQLEVFVLDEADMMLDLGFHDDVRVIANRIPEKRQTILFSATMPKMIERLAKSILKKPIKFKIAPESTPVDKVEQRVYMVEDNDKVKLLAHLLDDESLSRVLVFCKAKYAISEITKMLKELRVSSSEIHSNRSQNQRDEAIAEFANGNIRVLVATDLASRGLDIKNVSHVINFNLPDDVSFYIHRIGRTARAGEYGVAISLCGQRDLSLLRRVQKKISFDIPVDSDQPFHKEFAPLEQKEFREASAHSKRQGSKRRPSQSKRNSKKKFLEQL